MRKLLTSLTFLVLPISAQYAGLVTTADGSRLYFSSSLRLRGTTEVDVSKIFRYFVSFELVQEPTAPGEIVVEPEVSSDGSVVGYTSESASCLIQFCYNYSDPPPVSGRVEDIKIPHNPLPSLAGRLRLSRDGKFAMVCCADVNLLSDSHLVNLPTGAVTDLKGFDGIGDGRQAFGNLSNGKTVVLLTDATGPLLYQQGKIARLHFSHTAVAARMSSDARTIVYESADLGGRYELIVHHIGTGTEDLLQQGPAVPPGLGSHLPLYFDPRLSDDGSAVLYLRDDPASGNKQLIYQLTNGSGMRKLAPSSDVPEGVISGILSGDNTTAFAATPLGRILRISVPSGKIDELAGPTPQLYQVQNTASGSVNWISGAALTAGGTLPKMQVGDFEAPVISAEPALVKFQIPWEVRPGQNVEVRLQYGDPPPFESVLTYPSAAIAAGFLNPMASPFSLGLVPPGLANHEDFRSYVTPSNPALPGEIIHFYMAGVGPVNPPISTGQKTPTSGPPHRAVYPFLTCSVTNITTPSTQYLNAPVHFLGLAPGYIGLYQLDIQVPQGLVNADSPLSCESLDLEGGGYQVPNTDLYVRVP